MTNSKVLIYAGALLCIAGSAQAEYRLGNWDLSGTVSIDGQMVSGDNEDHAQFNKFTDLKDGATGGLSLSAQNGSYSMDFNASNIGRKNQGYFLSGGRAESFSYKLFYNEIINNKSTYDAIAKSIWVGAGTGTITPATGLDLTVANPNGEGFIPLDFKIQRKNMGVSMDLLKSSAFFAKIGYNRETQDGNRVMGLAPLLSTSSTVFELPEPIDTTTDSVNASLGYRTDSMTASFDGYFSQFDNNIEKLTWTPGNLAARNATGLKDTTLLAQDNKFYNLNLRDTIRDLPLDSTFTAKLGMSRITSKFDVLNSSNADLLYSTSDASAGDRVKYGTIATVVTDRPDFDGVIKYSSADLALASSPVEKLNTRLFYGYLNKKNESSRVTYSGFPTITTRPGASGNYNGTSGVFSYFKHHAGADASYKLPADSKIGLMYDFLHVNRTEGREPNPANTDHKVSLSLSNDSLDWLSSKIRYTYLTRLPEYEGEEGAVFFDAAAKRMNTLALEFEAVPMEHLDAGLSASYSYAKYMDSEAGVSAGRLNDHNLVVATNVGYEFGKGTHLGIYGELDRYTSETEIHAPSLFKDNYYTLGSDFTMPIVDSVSFRAGYQYHRGKASAEGNEYDLAAASSSSPLFNGGVITATTAGLAGAIPYLDTYTRHTAAAQVSYQVLKNLAAKIAYSFSKLDYVDERIEAYVYNNPSATASAVYNLSGATKDWDYKAHTGTIGVEYTF